MGRLPIKETLSVLILAISVLILAACSEGLPALGEQNADEPKARQADGTEAPGKRANDGATHRGNADARDGDSEVENKGVKRDNTAGSDRIRKVTLEISGDPGTGFSGTCTVGDERKELDGQVPERFVYELDGGQLRCEIQTEDTAGATLKTVLTAGNAHYIQQTGTRGATMSFVYSDSGFSSSTVSSAGATSTSSASSYSSSEGDR
jgi:hypothetical protein